MSAGRITYDDNGASLDEIVLEGVTFHMERMSHHGWWIGVTAEDGTSLRICWDAMGEPVLTNEGTVPIPTEWSGPLLFHNESRWTGAHGVEHRCEVGSGYDDDGRRDTHKRCRCECGATRKRPTARGPVGHRDRQGRTEALDESEGEA